MQLSLILTDKPTPVAKGYLSKHALLYMSAMAEKRTEWIPHNLPKLFPKVIHITSAPFQWPKKVIWPSVVLKEIGKYNPTIFPVSRKLEILEKQNNYHIESRDNEKLVDFTKQRREKQWVGGRQKKKVKETQKPGEALPTLKFRRFLQERVINQFLEEPSDPWFGTVSLSDACYIYI